MPRLRFSVFLRDRIKAAKSLYRKFFIAFFQRLCGRVALSSNLEVGGSVINNLFSLDNKYSHHVDFDLPTLVLMWVLISQGGSGIIASQL